MAAISLMMELFDSGSHFVCTEDLYGGSVRIFEALEKKRGFSFSYINTADVEAVEKAITDQTKALYIETPRNLNREQKEALRKFSDTLGESNYEQRKSFFGKFKL